jgi:hypothetical protein
MVWLDAINLEEHSLRDLEPDPAVHKYICDICVSQAGSKCTDGTSGVGMRITSNIDLAREHHCLFM